MASDLILAGLAGASEGVKSVLVPTLINRQRAKQRAAEQEREFTFRIGLEEAKEDAARKRGQIRPGKVLGGKIGLDPETPVDPRVAANLTRLESTRMLSERSLSEKSRSLLSTELRSLNDEILERQDKFLPVEDRIERRNRIQEELDRRRNKFNTPKLNNQSKKEPVSVNDARVKAIQADVKSGSISKDEGLKKLKALGFK